MHSDYGQSLLIHKGFGEEERVMSLSGFTIRVVLASYNELGKFLPALFPERICVTVFSFPLKCLIEFISENQWPKKFLDVCTFRVYGCFL